MPKPRLKWSDEQAECGQLRLEVEFVPALRWLTRVAFGGGWQRVGKYYDTEEAAQLAAEAHLRGVLKAALAELGDDPHCDCLGPCTAFNECICDECECDDCNDNRLRDGGLGICCQRAKLSKDPGWTERFSRTWHARDAT